MNRIDLEFLNFHTRGLSFENCNSLHRLNQGRIWATNLPLVFGVYLFLALFCGILATKGGVAGIIIGVGFFIPSTYIMRVNFPKLWQTEEKTREAYNTLIRTIRHFEFVFCVKTDSDSLEYMVGIARRELCQIASEVYEAEENLNSYKSKGGLDHREISALSLKLTERLRVFKGKFNLAKSTLLYLLDGDLGYNQFFPKKRPLFWK